MSKRFLAVIASLFARAFHRVGALVVLPLLVLGTTVPVLRAGVTGSISGTVTDSTGGVIPNASVVALNTETGIKHTTQTNREGFYVFPVLPVGHYNVTIASKGFKEYRQTGLVINFNSALRVDVGLAVGAVTQEVSVSAATVQVETTSTQMGEVIGSTKMTSLPLDGRAYTDLLALQTGVVPGSSGLYSPAAVSGELNAGGQSVNGARETGNGFNVNGGTVEEDMYNGAAVVPNLDSIAEFRILTNNFDAEYGSYNGGQVNVVTKSGANTYHGNVFEFLRNSDMDARNFYSYNQTDPVTGLELPGTARGELHRNQFGGTMGGPIRRDKLFFFGDYQGTREVVGVASGLISVPSDADRTGNLSDLSDTLIAANATVNGAAWANVLSQELGYPVTAGEPYFTYTSPGPDSQPVLCTSSAQGCVFPNAVVPQAAWASPVTHLLPYIPESNIPGGYFTTSKYKQTLRDDKGSGRIDGNTRWGMISGYYFLDDYNLVRPYAWGNLPGFSTQTIGRAQLVSLNDTKSLGSSAVNEFHFSYMRDGNYFNDPIGGVGPKLSSLGFQEGTGTLGIVPGVPSIEGVPPMAVGSMSFGVARSGGPQYNNTFQWKDGYSKVVGTHTLKFGGDYHFDNVYTKSGGGVRNGSFTFRGSETGSPLVDFLIGAPTSYTQGGLWGWNNKGRFYGAYAQDSWRATPSVTLNYGVRWEVATPWWEARNQEQALVPGLQSESFPGAPVGWLFVGDHGIPSTIAPTRYYNFAPRIGIAYSPSGQAGLLGKLLGGAGRTSIRASFGTFYTTIEETANQGAVGDAPFALWWSSPAQPMFATPFVDRATGHSEGQRYPVPAVPSNVSPQHPDNNVNWAQFEPITGSPGVDLTNRVPYAEHYSFSLQRQFGSNTLVSLSYVGTQGHKLLAVEEANPGNQALCLALSDPDAVAPGTSTCGPWGEDGVYTTASGQNLQGTRGPFGGAFGSDGRFSTLGNSNYNSLQATLRHSSGRMEFLLGYTYSKSLDSSSSSNGEQASPFYDSRATKALSAFDMTHNFVASYTYEVPLDKLFGASHTRLTRGWQFTGITRFATGFPVTFYDFNDYSLLGTYSTTWDGIDTPNYTPGKVLTGNNPRSGLPYFDPSLFSEETLGHLGTASRRFFHGPGINNWDLAMHKEIKLTESKTLELRGEFFNVFNHAQFYGPDGAYGDSTLGYVLGAGNGRIGQVAVKLAF